MAVVWKWLLSNPWRTAALTLLLALGWQHFIVAPAKDAKIAQLKLDKADLNAKVIVQNAAVRQWQDEAKRAAENQKRAMDLADKSMAKTQGTVKTIMDRPVPTPDKECEATFDLLKDFQL
jgi:hypothetical protein